MGLFDRLSRVVRANLNDLVSKAEDPEKVLEQTIIDMGEDLIQLKQAVARTMAERNRSEQRYKQDLTEANKWEQRAKLALSKGEESLAREALVRKKSHGDVAATLKAQLEQQNAQVETLRRNLVALESKISEAKTKKNMLIARAKAAKANEALQGALGGINTSGSMAAFERMEDKVLEMEARSEAAGELTSSSLDNQFLELEAGSGVDDELAMLKAQITGSAQPQGALPEASSNEPSSPKDKVVDAELEDLRRQLDNL
ncbi:PspA/IM30 family protein [Crocosphaera sp. UHCC 0190]|uniref:PspA/IM30 family protein n=1 Tax=Crocosphaera sp. UHCC 0190 TaxID=3110246 RepID=UPI002B1F550F|nr:PspA/IM30 family protein [Crocosphaera sp. UHCC 0190]MEA5511482.1 PspA/IM30 family protein [Crocosphaera sp. UHCC 0190]